VRPAADHNSLTKLSCVSESVPLCVGIGAAIAAGRNPWTQLVLARPVRPARVHLSHTSLSRVPRSGLAPQPGQL